MPKDSIDKFYSDLTTLTGFKMEPQELVLLLHMTQRDVNQVRAAWEIDSFSSLAEKNYYDFTAADIEGLTKVSITEAKELLRISDASNLKTEFPAYLSSLASLHKRRSKFYNILKSQPFPTFQQVSPRGLLEYSLCPHKLLFSWLQWRKWIYDVDNRSAQETGYLFEPILATCLGGEPRSHTKSPVKRLDKEGYRQVDCYVEEKGEVYELKMRVTIAASGQGRFGEELSFPKEAKAAGLTPILVVFDESPSTRLTELIKAYESHGGIAKIGSQAWDLLVNKAGPIMGLFINKYVKPVIEQLKTEEASLPESVQLTITEDNFVLQGRETGLTYTIPRALSLLEEEEEYS